jgi:hypothetical protein
MKRIDERVALAAMQARDGVVRLRGDFEGDGGVTHGTKDAMDVGCVKAIEQHEEAAVLIGKTAVELGAELPVPLTHLVEPAGLAAARCEAQARFSAMATDLLQGTGPA